MKTILYAIVFFISGFLRASDFGFYTEIRSAKDFGEYSNEVLKNNLENILNRGGFLSSSNNRFVIVAIPFIEDVSIIESGGGQYGVTLSLLLKIGDNMEKLQYSSLVLEKLKGIDANKEKALIMALGSLKQRSSQIVKYIEESRGKIKTYYENRCDEIISESRTFASNNNFDTSLFLLSTIPNFCDSCYIKAQSEIVSIYKDKMDFECASILTEVKALMASDKYLDASSRLVDIPPGTSCESEVLLLMSKIEKHWCSLEISAATGCWYSRDMDCVAEHLSMIPDNSLCKTELDKLKSEIRATLAQEEKNKYELSLKNLENQRLKDLQDFELDRDQQRSDNEYRNRELESSERTERLRLQYNYQMHSDDNKTQRYLYNKAAEISKSRSSNLVRNTSYI